MPAQQQSTRQGVVFEEGFDRRVQVEFDAEAQTSDAGVVLLARADEELGLSEDMARQIHDPRQHGKVRHEFVDVYPMLPGQIELILQITSALRTRSQRAQGDDQAIRGLLQLLGELFRDQKLAEKPVGSLVTLDQIYEVQHTALDSDTQASMARLLAQCDDERERLHVRAAKAVALLEQIQETTPTDPKLVAQSLYDRLDAGKLAAFVAAISATAAA